MFLKNLTTTFNLIQLKPFSNTLVTHKKPRSSLQPKHRSVRNAQTDDKFDTCRFIKESFIYIYINLGKLLILKWHYP